MSKNKKRFFIIVLAIAFLITLFSFFSNTFHQNYSFSERGFAAGYHDKKEFFKFEIPEKSEKQAIYGPLFLKGREYYILDTLEDGLAGSYVMQNGEVVEDRETEKKIIGLRNFYELIREDPLFYSPYFDAGEMERIVKSYDDYEETLLGSLTGGEVVELSKFYKENNQKLNLIPHNFLKSIPETILKTEKFYVNPSYENAQKLLTNYEKTNEEYKNGVKDALGIMEKSIEISKIENGSWPIISGFGVATSIKTIKDDLNVIVRNAEELEVSIEKRKMVLEGQEVIFESVNRSEIDIAETNPKVVVTQDEALNPGTKWENLIGDSMEDEYLIKGPYEIDTYCLGFADGFKAGKHLFYYSEVLEDGSWRFSTRLSALASERIYGPYIQEGGRLKRVLEKENWSRTNALSGCKCQTTAHDIINLQLIDFMHETLKANRIYNDTEPNDWELKALAEQGRFLEEEFLQYPAQSTLEKLGKNYREAYETIKNIEKRDYYDKAIVSAETANLADKKQKLLDYSLAIESKFFLFPEVLKAYLVIVKTRGRLFSEVNENLGGNEVINQDIMYSLMYAQWSDSVWRIEEMPQYVEKKQYKKIFLNEEEYNKLYVNATAKNGG